MRIEYDPRLIEQTVFHAGRLDPALEAEIHHATDPLFALPGDSEREARFLRVYLYLFRRLGLGRPLEALLSERNVLLAVPRCIVREAPATRRETAELFVDRAGPHAPAPQGTLVIQVCPPSLLDVARLGRVMRRELLHVADMLDEDFAYEAESLSGCSPQANLVRDRYAVLWDIYVEGRLTREGHPDDHIAQSLTGRFELLFRTDASSPTRLQFDDVFHAPILTHSRLLTWARRPQLFAHPLRATLASSIENR